MGFYLQYNNGTKILLTADKIRQALVNKEDLNGSTTLDRFDGSNIMSLKMNYYYPTYTINDLLKFLQEKTDFDYIENELLTFSFNHMIAVIYLLITSQISTNDFKQMMHMKSIYDRENQLLNWLKSEKENILYNFFNRTSITATRQRIFNYYDQIDDIVAGLIDIEYKINNNLLNQYSVECDLFNDIKSNVDAFSDIDWSYDKTITETLTPNYKITDIDFYSNSNRHYEVEKTRRNNLFYSYTTTTITEVTTNTFGVDISRINTHYDQIYNQYMTNQEETLSNKIKAIQLNDSENLLTLTYYDDFTFNNADLLKYYIKKYSVPNAYSTIMYNEEAGIDEVMLKDLYNIVFMDNLSTSNEYRTFKVHNNVYKNILPSNRYAQFILNINSIGNTIDDFFLYTSSPSDSLESSTFTSVPEAYTSSQMEHVNDVITSNDITYNSVYSASTSYTPSYINSYINKILPILNRLITNLDICNLSELQNNKFIFKIDVCFEYDSDKQKYYISNFGDNGYIEIFKSYIETEFKNKIEFTFDDFLSSTKKAEVYDYLMTGLNNKLHDIINNNEYSESSFYYVLLADALYNYIEYIFDDGIEYEKERKYYIDNNICELYKRICIVRQIYIDIFTNAPSLESTGSELSSTAIKECSFDYTPAQEETINYEYSYTTTRVVAKSSYYSYRFYNPYLYYITPYIRPTYFYNRPRLLSSHIRSTNYMMNTLERRLII